jgi:hypothetical protein
MLMMMSKMLEKLCEGEKTDISAKFVKIVITIITIDITITVLDIIHRLAFYLKHYSNL